MKKFITTVLSISVFFVGLGAVAENIALSFYASETAGQRKWLTIESARPNIKIIKVNAQREIRLRQLEFKSLEQRADCPFKIDRVFRDQAGQKHEINLDDADSPETQIRQYFFSM